MLRTSAPTTCTLRAVCFTILAFAGNTFQTYAQLPDYLPTDGLVAWWPFNGNANDESGNGNDGVVNGATLTEDRNGVPNSAYNFNGIDNYIEVFHNPQLSFSDEQAVTLSYWLSISELPLSNEEYQLFMKVEGGGSSTVGYQVAMFENGIVTMRAMNGPGTPWISSNCGPLNSDPNYVHIVHMIESDSVKCYLNGVLVSSEQNDEVFGSNNQNLLIGWNNTFLNSASVAFKGSLDDIAFWNRPLTTQEVTSLYTGVPFVPPCADPTACNFEQEGECVFAEPNLDCAGNCLNDCNNNGVCDEDEFYGCTYAFACNYNQEATTDDGSCIVAVPNYDCEGNCILDLNNNGLCDLEEVAGCTNIDAINYDAEATLDDGSCMVTCKGDFDNDGQITINDLLGFLAAFGNQCAGAGCMDPAGCNYDPNATFDLDFCEYPLEFYACDGTPINDADGDGIPDELEVAGCTDPEAGNYNPEATDDDGSCSFGLTGATHSCGAENVHNPDLVYGSVTDIDGNTYRTIVIGEQEWMAENLTVEHYANGDPIPQVTNNNEWSVLSSGAWCYYANNVINECPYGKLYNWYVTIDARNVCPTGWHVPTAAEWTILAPYLGGVWAAGGKMKSTGTEYWESPNTEATNESGFSGLPGGLRNINGGFDEIRFSGFWWTTAESDNSNAIYRALGFNTSLLDGYFYYRISGFSVRCLKD